MPLDSSNVQGIAATAASQGLPGGVNTLASPLTSQNYSSLPSGSATQLYGQIAAGQWQDYVSNFVPIENQLIQYATNPNQAGTAMQTASANVNQAYNQQAGMQSRRLAQFGVSLNPEEAAAAAKDTALSRVTSDVTAQNQAKDQVQANQMSILGSPMTGVTGSGGA